MPLILLLLWLVAEMLLSARLAELIGSGWLLLWMLAGIVLGAAIIRRGGWQASLRLREALARDELPARDMLDALLHFLAGVLLILPGPLSDAIGLALLLPVLRQPALRAADAAVRRARQQAGGPAQGSARGSAQKSPQASGHDPVIIEGEFEDLSSRDGGTPRSGGGGATEADAAPTLAPSTKRPDTDAAPGAEEDGAARK